MELPQQEKARRRGSRPKVWHVGFTHGSQEMGTFWIQWPFAIHADLWTKSWGAFETPYLSEVGTFAGRQLWLGEKAAHIAKHTARAA